jgi:hypothetical protein
MVVSGEVGRATATIPWKSLGAEGCSVQLESLELTLAPRPGGAATPGETERQGKREVRAEKACAERAPTYLVSFSRAPSPLKPSRWLSVRVDAGEKPATDPSATAPPPAYVGADDGIRVIAMLVEKVLLRMSVRVTDLRLYVEGLPEATPSATGTHGPTTHPI